MSILALSIVKRLLSIAPFTLFGVLLFLTGFKVLPAEILTGIVIGWCITEIVWRANGQ